MADSRRYESRFKISAHRYRTTLPVNTVTLWGSTSSLYSFTVANLGVRAFAKHYSWTSGNDGWDFVTRNYAYAANGEPIYPTSSFKWDDALWGRIPSQVAWFDENQAFVLGINSESGFVSKTTAMYKYVMYVGFLHTLEIKNESMNTATVSGRGFNMCYFNLGAFTSMVMTSWVDVEIAPGATELFSYYEPMEIQFDNDCIGGEFDFSVTDQNGSVRRISGSGTGGYTLKTSDGSIVDTPITSGLLAEDDGQVIIGDYLEVTEGTKPIFADIGTGADSPLFANVGDSIGKPLFAAIVEEEQEPEAPGSISGFAYIEINWSSATIEDLDCLGYWTDLTAQQLGWNYSAGSVNDPFKAVWQGDNTGAGPEYIQVGVDGNEATGVETRTYKIHLNFYGYRGSGSSTARVTVTYGGVSLYKTITPSTNSGKAATVSDPSVTITFNADGTPASIA
jgi:hypothetical protein